MSRTEILSPTNGHTPDVHPPRERPTSQVTNNCDAVANEVRAAIALLQRAGDAEQPLLSAIADTLGHIQATLASLDERVNTLQEQMNPQPIRKEWYDVSEAAEQLGKAQFTVREWCRLNRINAYKRQAGRGGKHEWMISQAEIDRIQEKGLLPMDL